jgi:hypothetical protein
VLFAVTTETVALFTEEYTLGSTQFTTLKEM